MFVSTVGAQRLSACSKVATFGREDPRLGALAGDPICTVKITVIAKPS